MTTVLTKKEIEHILDESKKYISFNKKKIKKINVLFLFDTIKYQI